MPFPSLPAAERRDVVLHGGMGKTGTTSLQAWLHRNRAVLVEHGILYPASPGKRRHIRLGLAMQREGPPPRPSLDWRRQRVGTPGELRPLFEKELLAELESVSTPRLVFSDEALFGARDEGLRNLRQLMDRMASRVRVVLYLRRQDDHLISRYQQVVKMGEVRRLDRRLREVDTSSTYDYRARLDTWQRLLRPDELVVRRFERDALAGGSLHQDFIEAAGLGVTVEDLAGVTVRNESLDAESVEFLRLLNIHRVEHEGAQPVAINNRQVVVRLAKASTGPILTLPDDVLDEFMDRWRPSNRAVARDYFAEGDAELFRSPRKAGNTTTEQVLDPARIDHFVAVAELPERFRSVLRRLAEREAAAG